MNGSIKKANRIADPWVLGLFGLGGATFVVAAHMAQWYGGVGSVSFLVPFVAILGGLAQFVAAMWAFAADDVLATAMLGTWGSFWMAYGLLTALIATGRLAAPSPAFPELAFWFIAMAAITWIGAAAATRASATLASVFALFAIASTLAAVASGLGIRGLGVLAGWVFVIGAVSAWYTASAALLNEMSGREVLPIGWPATSPALPHGAPAAGGESGTPVRRVS